MTLEMMKIKARDTVEKVINAIAEQNVPEILALAKIDIAWCMNEKTGIVGSQAEGVKRFIEWLFSQLAVWSDEDDTQYYFDHYGYSYLKLDERLNMYGALRGVYSPTSEDEIFEAFRIEFFFKVRDGERLLTEFYIRPYQINE
ncbi:MAG: hypothetical protein IJ740_02740 [Ruminococcus sp.]|nr:hypothetical protein [Ruminococcus sp.]